METLLPKFRLPLNLQLFAINGDGVDDVEDTPDDDPTDEDQDELEVEDEVTFEDDDADEDSDDLDADDSDADDEPEDDPVDEKPTKGAKGKGNNETASAVIAERNKWKAKLEQSNKRAAMADKIMKLAGVDSIEAMQQRLDAAEANTLATQSGLTPEQARKQIEDRRELDGMKQQIQDQKYDQEYQRLKADPFYADIDTYKDEFQDIANRTGQTLEEVYLSKRGRERMKERESEIEARVKGNKDKRQSKKVDTKPTGGSGGSKGGGKKLNLTTEQREAAEYGVKKGYFKSIEEYARHL